MAAFDYSSSFAGINNALSNIGKQNEIAYQRQTLANLGQKALGGDYSAAAQAAFAAGDAGTGLGLLKLGQTQKQESDWLKANSGILGGGAAPTVPAPGSTAPVAGPASLIQDESGGNWQAQNDAVGAGGAVGHFGRLQFGRARIQDAINAGALPAGTTPQAFMASPELQKRAEAWHFSDIDRKIQQNGFDKLIGQSINGVPITVDGLRAVAHLGGTEGMRKFVESGGRYNPADKNGTRLSDYFARHGGAGTGRPTQVAQPPLGAPVQVAENEADVARLEAQMPGYGGARPAQVAQANVPGDDPVKLRSDAQYYAQSNPEAARQLNARADALEQSRGTQVAQAAPQPGQPVADAPASGAKEAQFVLPGTGEVIPQAISTDPAVRSAMGRYVTAPTERTRAVAKQQLDLAVADAKQRQAVNAPTDVQRNYELARRQGYQGSLLDYQKELRPQNNVNLPAGEKEYDKQSAKDFAELNRDVAKRGMNANGKIATLNRLESLLSNPNVKTGAGAQAALTAARAAKAIFGIDTEGLGPAEAVNAIANGFALELRNPSGGAGMPGALSDKDREFLMSLTPGLERTPEGNKLIIDYMKRLAKRDIEIEGLRRDYIKQNKRLDDGFYEKLADFSEKNPLFPEAPAKPPNPVPSAAQAPQAQPAPQRPAGNGPVTITNPTTGQRLMLTPDGKWAPFDG